MPKQFDCEAVPGMPRMLGSKQVRKLLGMSQQTLDLACRCGKIRFVKFAGARLFPAEQFTLDDDHLQAVLDFPVASLEELEHALTLYRDPHSRAAAERAYVKPPPKPLDPRQNRFSNAPTPGTRQRAQPEPEPRRALVVEPLNLSMRGLQNF